MTMECMEQDRSPNILFSLLRRIDWYAYRSVPWTRTCYLEAFYRKKIKVLLFDP